MSILPSVLHDELLLVAVQQSLNALLITNADPSGVGPVIVYCNDALCRMTGYTREELIGQSPRILQGPGTDRQVLAYLRQCLEDGVYFEGEALNYRKNGTTYYVEWNISPVRDASGHVAYYVSVQRDVTVRVHAEQQRTLLARALNASNDAVWITDKELVIVFANQAIEEMTGYTRRELLGQKPMVLRSGLHQPEFYVDLEDCLARGKNFRGTFINRRKNGDLFYAEQSIAALRDAQGQVSHYVGVSKDITAQVQRETQLREQAHRDRLTGLLNRHAGEAELERCKMQALAAGQSFGLIVGDIDHFKQVSDTWGHGAGDQVLKTVASVLMDTVRSSDHVVRWGGEEFLVILPGVGLDTAVELAERMRCAVQAQPVPEAGHCTMSMGVGIWQLGESEEALLHRIDGALYTSKARGRNQVTPAVPGVVLHAAVGAPLGGEAPLESPER